MHVKKIVAFVCVLMLVMGICGCNEGNSEIEKTDKNFTNNTEIYTSIQESTSTVNNYKVGDYIEFGRYEQDNNLSNGKEPIEWQVLDIQDDKLLLISKYGLDSKQYHSETVAITWEFCTLRKWLNDTFLYTAFSDKEIAIISTTSVPAHANPWFEYITPGNPTKDKVFLLSIQELMEYLPNENDMNCIATTYAENNRGYVAENGYCLWWLRSPAFSQRHAVCVDPDFGFNSTVEGKLVWYEPVAIRPSLWIDLSPDDEQSPTEEVTEPSIPKYTVDNGCTYYVQIGGFELKEGEAIPDVIGNGDKYITEDYTYWYDSHYDGWSVKVNDTTKTKYGEILPSIGGVNIVRMEDTFKYCENMTIAPKIPITVTNMSCTFYMCKKLEVSPKIPSGVTNMFSTFYNCNSLTTSPELPSNVEYLCRTFFGCQNLTTAPVIPSGVLDMSYTFAVCGSLTGTISIDANPKNYKDCFLYVNFERQNIVLAGSSEMLEEIKLTSVIK